MPSSTPASPYPSPCIRQCTLNDDDVCLGCGRTLDDIRQWHAMSDAERAACVAVAQARLPGLRSDWTLPPPTRPRR